jgi:Ca-activated chloride channel family protein
MFKKIVVYIFILVFMLISVSSSGTSLVYAGNLADDYSSGIIYEKNNLDLVNRLFNTTYTDSTGKIPGNLNANFKQEIDIANPFHKGLDYKANSGTEVFSPVKGEIINNGNNKSGIIAVYDLSHDMTFLFIHMSKSNQNDGDLIELGELIGYSGTVGASGAHLHVELRKGKQTKASFPTNDDYSKNFDPRIVMDYYPTTGPSKSSGTRVVVNNSKVVISEINKSKFPEIKLSVSVVDKDNNPVEKLTKNDFHVYEDGFPREILSVKSLKGSNPLSILMILDVSNSMVGKPIEELKKSASDFIRMMPNNWKVQLIIFSDSINNSGFFTSDKNSLLQDIFQIYSHGGTRLHESLLLSYSISQQTKKCDAIIVFSDGVDTLSFAGSREKAISEANFLNCKAPIYSVGFLGDSGPTAVKIDEELLSTISTNTRGRFYKTPTLDEIKDLYQRISRILNNQYEITFKSEADGKKGDETLVRIENLDKSTNQWERGDRSYTMPQDGTNVPILLVHGWQMMKFSPVSIWADYVSYFSIDPITQKPTITADNIRQYMIPIDIPQSKIAFTGRKHKFWKVKLARKTIYISNYALHETTNPELDWTQGSIKTYAQNIADEVTMILLEEKVKKVDIIAHSMGGLVARTYIECSDFGLKMFNQNVVPVRRLIMLGTPNHGVLKTTLNKNVELQKKYYETRGMDEDKRKINTKYFGNYAINEITADSYFLNILNFGKKNPNLEEMKTDKLNPDVHYVTIAGMAYTVLDFFSYWDFTKLYDLYTKGELSDGFIRSDSVYLDGSDQYHYVWADHSGLIKKKKVFDMVRVLQKNGYVSKMEDYWDIQNLNSDFGYQLMVSLRCPAYMTISNEKGQEMDPFGLTPSNKKMQNVFYDFETESYKIINPQGKYTFHILGTNYGKFTLTMYGNLKNTPLFYEAKNVPIRKNEMDTFTIDTSNLNQNIAIQKDYSNDGVIDKKYSSPPPVSNFDLTKKNRSLIVNWSQNESEKAETSGYNLYAYTNNALIAKNTKLFKTAKSITYPIGNPKDYQSFYLLSIDKENSWNQSLSTKPLIVGTINRSNAQVPSEKSGGFIFGFGSWMLIFTFLLILLSLVLVIAIFSSKSSPTAFLQDNSGRTKIIEKLPFTIGRNPKCSLVFQDPHVSILHAVIIKQNNDYLLKDLKSSNGTYIKGQKIKQQVLRDQDEIKIGKTFVTFCCYGKGKLK